MKEGRSDVMIPRLISQPGACHFPAIHFALTSTPHEGGKLRDPSTIYNAKLLRMLLFKY